MTSASDDLRATAPVCVRARTTLCAVALSGGLILLGAGPASAVEQTPEDSPSPTTAIDAGQQDAADQEDGEDQPEQDVPEESDSTESGETEQSTDSASQSPEPAPSEDITQEPAPSDPSQEAEEPSAPDTPSDLEDGEPSPEPAPTPDEDGSADDGSAAPGTPEEPQNPEQTPQGPEPEPNDPEASSLDCRSTASPGETVSIRVLGADSLQLGNGATGVLGGTAEAAGDTVTYTAPHSDTGVDSFSIVDASGASELCKITVSGSFEELDSGDSADEPDPSSTPTGEPEYGVPGMPSTSAGSAAESQDPSDSSEEERQSGSDNSSPESPSQNDEASQDEDDSQDAEQESSDDEDLAETGMDSASTLSALFLALGAVLSGVAALMVARRRA